MEDLFTDRLQLHPLSRTEAEQLLAGVPSTLWHPEYPSTGDVIAARRLLLDVEPPERCAPFGTYEVRLRADGRAVGGAGFHRPPDAQGRVTIGYGLVSAVRGNGYATEALRALIALARRCGATAVEGDADLANVASQRVMLRAGMSDVGADETVRCFRIVFAEGAAGPGAADAA
ncbi:GNAT family N-acetyltransferase [Streptomyces xiaopingdaonensis]|uniref:GNAT family N-acetyltransferase n=1 Tax=Streptomyces xiaopingdaonensis TaxID=1565415 RepID=UPI0002F6FB5B|nr:GNAT family N-acetyltransferase [Streptomyces xiaopingdaonensis]